ncbi:MAG: hypothetical protein D6737_09665 [Chloroflexi bacterium]|nr:MAG: hypothetical protein D6737_09665 [Chloroflexota bacterium]
MRDAMLSVFAKLSLILTLLFAISVGLIRAQRYDDTPLRSLLFHQRCPAICWQGIRPGVTTRAQALQILEDSGWVEAIRISENVIGADVDSITWSWNGRQPNYIDMLGDGRLVSDNGIVQSLALRTRLPFADVRLLLNAPDDGATVSGLVVPPVEHRVDYHEMGIRIRIQLQCPFTPLDFWSAPITIELAPPFVSEFPHYRLPGWLGESICTR